MKSKIRKLIIVEGLPGSGKSTTAGNVASYLKDAKEKVDLFYENSLDNPVGYIWKYSEILKAIEHSNLEEYPFHSWLNIDNEDSTTTVLESRLLQNLSLLNILNGGSENLALELPKKVLETVEDYDVRLIFLETSNPQEHFSRIIPPRKKNHPNWIPFVVKLFDPQPFLKQRGLSGELGYIAAMSEWEFIQRKIVRALDCKKLILQDPYLNWPASLSKIYEFVT